MDPGSCVAGERTEVVGSSDWLAQTRAVVREGYGGAVRRWRASRPGGRVAGCFPVYSPVEIFHAAGFLPIALCGSGEIELTHADARFQSFVCSIAKSTLELGLQGRLEGIDVAVFHSICDVARNLAWVFRRNFPAMHVEFIHFPQGTASDEGLRYLEVEYQRVVERLSQRFGVEVHDEALVASIRLYNRVRDRMRRIAAWRVAEPHRIPAHEAYLLARAGTLLPPEEWLGLAEVCLAAAEARQEKPRDRVRVILEGAFCELPPPDLVDAIERAGCYVVEDDLLAGWNWFERDVAEELRPLRALARAYLESSRPCSVRHDPARPRGRMLVERVRRSGAQAVLFLPAKFCEPALLDYVVHRRALAEADIPHLTIEFEEKMWTFDRPQGEVETFVESILFDEER